MSSPTDTPLPTTPPPQTKKTREERAFIVFRRLCKFRLPHLSYEDSLTMLHVLDCDSMHAVWTYAVGPYNRPHFTRLIQKLQSLADYIVDTNTD